MHYLRLLVQYTSASPIPRKGTQKEKTVAATRIYGGNRKLSRLVPAAMEASIAYIVRSVLLILQRSRLSVWQE